MKLNCDYHTHTKYSHGKGTILENAVSASKLGLREIAITDHGFSHPAFGMRRRKLDRMKAECQEATKITGVNVKLGIESNILGESGKIDVKPKDYEKLDMILAGVHRFVLYDGINSWAKLLFKNMTIKNFHMTPSQSFIDYNTKVYINAIKNNPIDILTHVNYLVFCDPVEVAKCCADYGTYFEINTKKIHLSTEQWQKVIDTKVNFIIDSDAHSVDRIGDTKLFDEQDKLINFPKKRIFNIGDNVPTFRFAELKKKL